MDDGLKIVLSPVQLAATLSDATVTEAETWSNRILGGIGVVMGAAELAGATALCIVPEPTGLTKAGCVVVGAHSMDTINTAANQMINGRDVRTATYQLAVKTAQELGADNDTAYNIGFTVDIAVPAGFSLTIGAARILSVRAGRIRLQVHESNTGIKPGGHVLEKHIGKSEAELRQRLKQQTWLQGSSTFYNARIAEETISRALKFNALYIKSWAKTATPNSSLRIDFFAGKDVGFGLRSASGNVIKSAKIRVILRCEQYNSMPYYVLTAFPSLD